MEHSVPRHRRVRHPKISATSLAEYENTPFPRGAHLLGVMQEDSGERAILVQWNKTSEY